MREDQKSAFSKLLGGVHDFYGKEITPFAFDVWWRCCEGSDLEQVSAAFSYHLADPERGQWMPKPADLVRQLEGTQGDRARRAWGKVLDAMQSVGAYSSVVFDEPAIHAAIEDVGGWQTICRLSFDELPHTERRFCASYRAYLAPGKLQTWPAVLAGEHDSANQLRGYGVKPPTLIGNPEAAKETMRLGGKGRSTQTSQIGNAYLAIEPDRQNQLAG